MCINRLVDLDTYRETDMRKDSRGIATNAFKGCVLAGTLGVAMWVEASPSGLNNIPTADTCTEQTAVFQTWEGFGGGNHSENWVGVKYGLFENAEIGADWRTTDPYRDPQFQAKYTLEFAEDLPRFAIGIANVTTDRSRNGDPMPYGVLTYNLKDWCRLHAGYGFEKDNEGAFGGIDRTFKVAGMNVMLCGDVIQCDGRDDALLAPGIKIGPAADDIKGLLGTILRHTAFETWTTLSTSGESETYVAKLNVIIGF